MPTSEYDMQRCPTCNGTRIISFLHAATDTYGSKAHEAIQIIYAMPLRRCLNDKCQEVWSDHEGEKAQTDALARYRKALCPPASAAQIKRWCIDNGAMLEHLSPQDIVRAWTEYRERFFVEAGAGVEPTTTGV